MIEKIITPAAVSLGFVVALLVVRSAAFRILHRWAEKTTTKVDDLIIRSIKAPSIFWAVALGVYLGIALSDLPARYSLVIGRAINALLILSVTIALARLSGKALNQYVKNSNLPIPTTGLANGVMQGIIYCIGILIVLSLLGVSITPMITALDVGGLAVALALQDTLANLFAGIHVLTEKSVRVGDFIKLESGQEGHVDDITWRTTRVRMLPNNVVVIPNSKLAQSVVTNYYPKAFEFKQCVTILKLTGKKAKNLRELKDVLAEVGEGAIARHMFQSILKGHIMEYRNDFAH